MKALDEYFLMVVFTLLLNTVYVFFFVVAIFMLTLDIETWQRKGSRPSASNMFCVPLEGSFEFH